jgi:cell pole-organizing protein PopZ
MDEPGPAQSMEDILASIKRVITADVAAASPAPVAGSARAAAVDDVLELGVAPTGGPASLVSERVQEASRNALASLAGLRIDPLAGEGTLDGLVREMLRPMLKDWLDANLPELVERVVTREVARVIGR